MYNCHMNTLLLTTFSTNQVLITYFVSAVIGLIILYFIINAATNANKILEEQKKQTALLAKMAKQNGINANEIEQVMGADKY